jgi:hypothetical protein
MEDAEIGIPSSKKVSNQRNWRFTPNSTFQVTVVCMFAMILIFSAIAAFRSTDCDCNKRNDDKEDRQKTILFENNGVDTSPESLRKFQKQVDEKDVVALQQQKIVLSPSDGEIQKLENSILTYWPWELSTTIRDLCEDVMAIERFSLSDFGIASAFTMGGSDLSISTENFDKKNQNHYRGSNLEDMRGIKLGETSIMILTSSSKEEGPHKITDMSSAELKRIISCKEEEGVDGFKNVYLPSMKSDVTSRLLEKLDISTENLGPCVRIDDEYKVLYDVIRRGNTQDIVIVPFSFVSNLYYHNNPPEEEQTEDYEGGEPEEEEYKEYYNFKRAYPKEKEEKEIVQKGEERDVFTIEQGMPFKEITLDGKKFYENTYPLKSDVWIYTLHYYNKEKVRHYVDCLFSRRNHLKSSGFTHVWDMPFVEKLNA